MSSISVRTGADRLLTDSMQLIEGRNIAVLTNHTGRLSSGEHLVDALVRAGGARIMALFGPEHGMFGDTPDGSAVGHSHHASLGIPVYSLYGKTHKPTPDMLKGVDLLVCDIQDVGARFYTYISTMALAIEAAAEASIPVVVLDRPAMIRALAYDGPVRPSQLRSFVSLLPIPVTYGMTIGELMTMCNAEGWLKDGVQADMNIVRLEGWSRALWYDETALPWISPSPNLPDLSTAVIYPGQCFIEGTHLSEGRGTDAPFSYIGAPWVDADRVLDVLAACASPGVKFTNVRFTPRSIPGVAVSPKYEQELCRGIRITVTDRNAVRPVRLGIDVLYAFRTVHPEQEMFRVRRFDILTGSTEVRTMLNDGAHPHEVAAQWDKGLSDFAVLRRRYLIYS